MIPTGIIIVGSLKIKGPLCCVWHGMATAAQAEGTKGRRDRGRQTIRARGDDRPARTARSHYPGFGYTLWCNIKRRRAQSVEGWVSGGREAKAGATLAC